MSNRISIKEVEQAIAGGRCIAVRADQVIWSYAKTNKGWVRVRTELSSPEAAERRLVAYADEGDLILDAKANGDPTAVLKWFDEVLHARVSDLKSKRSTNTPVPHAESVARRRAELRARNRTISLKRQEETVPRSLVAGSRS